MNSLNYLKWIKVKYTHCLITGAKAEHYHHLDAVGMGGDRKKENDKHFSVIPLSAVVHQDIHALPKDKFNQKYGFPGRNLYEWLWKEVARMNREFYEEINEHHFQNN